MARREVDELEKKKLYKIVVEKEAQYFEDKKEAKQTRNLINMDRSKPITIKRGPDHRNGETF